MEMIFELLELFYKSSTYFWMKESNEIVHFSKDKPRKVSACEKKIGMKNGNAAFSFSEVAIHIHIFCD